MKVTFTNTQQVNHKALKISHSAELKLRGTDYNYIGALFHVGRLHENNQYIDICVTKNLTYKIKEKANPFFCIKEPMSVNKLTDKKINISAIYDGVENELIKKGDKYDIAVEYDSPNVVNMIMNKFESISGLFKLSYIAKLIEDYMVRAKSEFPEKINDREKILSLLMYKYGDIVV